MAANEKYRKIEIDKAGNTGLASQKFICLAKIIQTDYLPILHGEGQENLLQLRNTVYVCVFNFPIPVAATADLMLSRIGPIEPLLLLVDHFSTDP